MKKIGLRRGIYILPNLFTTGNLFFGFFSIIRSINEDFVAAAWAILFAGVCDFLDGRVARLTKTQSEFGLEYDSLVDLSSFGLATSILMYKFGLFYFSRIGWAACFLYFACSALRLARFNVQAGNVEKKHFQGLPVPGAASLLVTYVILYSHVLGGGPTESYLVLAMVFFVAPLMVSNVAYRSFKSLDRSPRTHFLVLVFVVVGVFVLASAPQIVLFVISLVYVLTGVLETIFRSHSKIKSFADVMKHFFQAGPKELVMPDEIPPYEEEEEEKQKEMLQ
ncbi:MAG: CDP-diacylglycerol--serine O-phosphatidyltransferase [Deltaproteobacteria bacterium RIFCSPLOWO2_12_FULL_40_28]|nr:MAG: CDP-diacylglycerol--serine O-phosphatidyltransferase [Deltaproteobacteria bacterium RIFCSPHIGHO2_02_FULL_40_28]OGQ18953.1 MAG: CDP-diacylglycerol--serine O-phosphatidyltransferase [Deltaproteobacteria bacterium RIFCSPHIGHO2_12_FULL_40_32]OGQ39496.1 MAG: CDP-diacylglycerol--serine O-phosphatidyltransferase [Deltaproteobacteria bacterium RIFCSPLOWO2_02_FULL_40_36]OGQ53386.1 MAG: CDP-diacylglycerol--serine O-phosphatidyltransferase [Deltaproteobacteria bacterium RIFCSPLOWO2_12_FULL_40_28]